MSEFFASGTDSGKIKKPLKHSLAFDGTNKEPKAPGGWDPARIPTKSGRTRTCPIHLLPKPEMNGTLLPLCSQLSVAPGHCGGSLCNCLGTSKAGILQGTTWAGGVSKLYVSIVGLVMVFV